MAALSILEPVLVIDDDVSVANLLASTLLELGFKDVEPSFSGEDATAKIKAKQYNLIILDWKMPAVTGLTMFNRIRQLENYLSVPVLVISGYLDVEDFRLLEEFPYSAMLPKPFAGETLDKALQNMATEKKWFDHTYPQVETILESIDDHEKLKHSIAVIISKSPRPEPLGLSVARRLIQLGRPKDAEAVLQILLKKSPRCALAMTLMGQVLLLLKRADDAQAYLLKAQKLCPDNISRLCLLGQTKMEKMELEEAQKYFNAAIKVDSSNNTANDGKTFTAKVSSFIKENTINHATANFSSLINMMGIAMIQDGNFDQGVKHYEKAWTFTWGDESKYKLAYNLGLAYLKWDKPEPSLDWFSTSLVLSNGSFAKSQKCADQIVKKFPSLRAKYDETLATIRQKLAHSAERTDESDASSSRTPEATSVSEFTPEAILPPIPVQAQQQSNQDQTLPASQQELLDLVPDCKHLINFLLQKGYPLDLHVEGYLKIYREYGRKAFAVGTKAAIKRKTPTHLALRSIVEELARHMKGAA
jgi:two-component system, chemotaxis family, chemotaxis protein CheY